MAPLAEKIIDVITPFLGAVKARSKVKAACKIAKVKEEKLDRMDVPKLAKQLSDLCADLGETKQKELWEAVLLLFLDEEIIKSSKAARRRAIRKRHQERSAPAPGSS